MAIGFAQVHNIFTEKDLRIIKHCRKSLLYVNNEPRKKKNTESCFDVTMGSYDGAEICELVGIYIQSKLAKLTDKKNLGLYRDDGLILLKNTKGREVYQIRKKVIKIFKDVGLKIEIKTNLKIVDFLDVTLNLSNGTYSPYNKPNDQLLYVHTSSNHPPQIINMLPKSFNERLSRNSSDPEIFDKAKIDYEKALKNSGYKSVNLTFKKPAEKQSRTRSHKIIWFNPPFNESVTTNVAKRFLNLVDRHFMKTNTLHKIFNRNTVKVSYSCTENMANVIKSHNKKAAMSYEKSVPPCNCRNKGDCPLDGLCQTNDIIYKCVVSTKIMPEKVYLRTAEGDFKKRYYNHRKLFKNRLYECDTTLSKYIWEIRDKYAKERTLK